MARAMERAPQHCRVACGDACYACVLHEDGGGETRRTASAIGTNGTESRIPRDVGRQRYVARSDNRVNWRNRAGRSRPRESEWTRGIVSNTARLSLLRLAMMRMLIMPALMVRRVSEELRLRNARADSQHKTVELHRQHESDRHTGARRQERQQPERPETESASIHEGSISPAMQRIIRTIGKRSQMRQAVLAPDRRRYHTARLARHTTLTELDGANHGGRG